MPISCSLSAVLLAGGQSRRMGCDKAFLDVGGEPLWHRQVAKLEGVVGEIFISVRDANLAIVSEYEKISDPPGAVGPLGGLVSALRTVSHPYLLVLAVDLPAMTPDYLVYLTLQLDSGVGVVPELDGFYLGTCAIYPAGVLSLAEEILSGRDPSFQNLIRRAIALGWMKAIPVGEKDRPLFANWNTPDLVF